MSRYADIVLPLAFGSALTYLVPEAMTASLRVGCRVRVPLGQNRHYVGIVVRIHEQAPVGRSCKTIDELVDIEPLLLEKQLEFWQWMADYYACTPGEVMKAGLPIGLKRTENYRPKRCRLIRLSDMLAQTTVCPENVRKMLARSGRQQQVVDYMMAKTRQGQPEWTLLALMSQTFCSRAVIDGLVGRGLLEVSEKEVSRLETDTEASLADVRPLSREQRQAYASIVESWTVKPVCLLHGVTSSGKTEIYIHLIKDCLSRGEQVLYLLPEIALTTQITSRLKKVFGNSMCVYHSKVSEAERVEIWNRLIGQDSYQLVVGVRSSVFLPFQRLGLVIVDEEHEPSYKQHEPAPRYHARNAALMLARLHGANALLGSASPSIESYNRAVEGKYGHVSLSVRYHHLPLPEILVEDVKSLRRRKEMQGSFSPVLIDKIGEALNAGDQAMLFLNRRGYAPLLSCHSCGWTPRCPHCDVSLHYHKQSGRLQCHYCGWSQPLPAVCPQCGSHEITDTGIGTEKIEEELHALFPAARLGRMDTDTMKSRQHYERAIADFEEHRTDILVGTQMLTKGLDFGRVRVVGILDADSIMNFPDFRAHERAFQLMMQVSGRAGRQDRRGTVVVQTRDPGQPLLQAVVNNDYKKMYVEEMQQRHQFSYPPYSYLVDVWFKHRDASTVKKAAECYASWIVPRLPDMVFGPFSPAVSRIKGLCLQKISLKLPPSLSLSKIKEYLYSAQETLHKNPDYRSVQLFFDVDPV